MKRYWNKLAFVAVALMATSMVACEKSEEQNEWNRNYVYLVPENLNILSTSFTLQHTEEDGITGPATSTSFTVCLNKPASEDVVIDLDIAKSENFPADKYQITAKSITIPAGKTSSEKIVLTVPDWSFQTANQEKALFPFVIKPVPQDAEIGIGRQAEISLYVQKNALLKMAVGIPTEGTLIKVREAWTIVVQPGVENADKPGYLIDGQSTDIAVNSGGLWFTVKLPAETEVTGFRTTSYGSSYAPTAVELYVSNDGVDWKSQGVLTTSGKSQNITLKEPISCRHLKYEVVKGTPTNGRLDITEFDVYAK